MPPVTDSAAVLRLSSSSSGSPIQIAARVKTRTWVNSPMASRVRSGTGRRDDGRYDDSAAIGLYSEEGEEERDPRSTGRSRCGLRSRWRARQRAGHAVPAAAALAELGAHDGDDLHAGLAQQ